MRARAYVERRECPKIPFMQSKAQIDIESDNVATLDRVSFLSQSLANQLADAFQSRARSITRICLDAIREGDPEGYLSSFRAAAHVANRLAKDVEARHGAYAYEIKDECLSALLRNHRATVNEIEADSSISLNILINPRSRLHTFLSKLQPDAQVVVRAQLGISRTTVPMSDRLPSDQVDILRTFTTKRSLAA